MLVYLSQQSAASFFHAGYLTIILRNRMEYRLMLSRRGDIPQD